MNLTEAKEQIAKEYEHESWTAMTYRLNKDAVNELLLEAHELVLSSKDKEIAELKASIKNCKDGNYLILNEKIEVVQELFETKSELSNLMEEVKDLRMQLIKKDEKINDLGDCLTLGRRYLMEVDPIDLSVESCLQAFGYNKNGFKN